MSDKNRKYMMVASSQKDNVIFENQTTACVIRIAVGDKEIWLDYPEFESLCDVIDNVRSIGDKMTPKVEEPKIIDEDTVYSICMEFSEFREAFLKKENDGWLEEGKRLGGLPSWVNTPDDKIAEEFLKSKQV